VLERLSARWTSYDGRTQSQLVSKLLYGSIIVLALEVALEDHPPAPRDMVASVVGTALAVTLAELYSDVIGLEIGRRRRVQRDELGRILRKVSAVALGAAAPVVWFALAWAGVLGLGTAFTLAKWTGMGLIGCFGFLAGRLAGNGVARSLLQAGALLLVAAGIVFVKALFH
jgi:VIT1/CCC1 family predicted Fe2+/Mn2+ transporter